MGATQDAQVLSWTLLLSLHDRYEKIPQQRFVFNNSRRMGKVGKSRWENGFIQHRSIDDHGRSGVLI